MSFSIASLGSGAKRAKRTVDFGFVQYGKADLVRPGDLWFAEGSYSNSIPQPETPSGWTQLDSVTNLGPFGFFQTYKLIATKVTESTIYPTEYYNFLIYRGYSNFGSCQISSGFGSTGFPGLTLSVENGTSTIVLVGSPQVTSGAPIVPTTYPDISGVSWKTRYESSGTKIVDSYGSYTTSFQNDGNSNPNTWSLELIL